MIAVLVAVAWADPVAARLPGADGLEVTAVIRSDTAGSVAVWDGARGAGIEASARAAGAWVGLRRAGTTGPRAGLTAGLVVPFAAPTVALTAAPWVGFGRAGERGLWTVGLAAPVAIRVAPTPRIEVPLLLEAGGGATFGRVSVAAGLSAGAVFGGAPPGLVGGLWLAGRVRR